MYRDKGPEFHLETKDGRQVYFQKEEKLFLAYNPYCNVFDTVEEALIKKGEPSEFPEAFIRKEFADNNLPLDIKYEVKNTYWQRIKLYTGANQYVQDLNCGSDYYKRDSYGNSFWHHQGVKVPVKFFYTTIDEKVIEIDEQKCRAILSKCEKYNNFLGLNESFNVNGETITFNILSKIIGMDNVVSVESLHSAKAIDDKEPKVWLQYNVSFDIKGTKLFGVVDSLTESGARVVLPDGTNKTIAYGKLKKEAKIKDDSFKEILSETVLQNFKDATNNLKLYKAKIGQRKLEIPMFSGNVRDCRAAHCPNCEMMLAATYGDVFVCGMCNQRAFLVDEQGDVGLFALAEKPNKNQFAVEEAQCCNNCSLFHFEYGRQGKRSTGYCQFSNQCVVAHNWCKKWMPVEPDRYGATLKQHTTNLGYGVEDSRNIKRRETEIEDMVYREEDHKKQKDKATKLKGAYSVQYGRFREDLMKKASELPIAELE